jgi:hypothetical protein
MNGLPFQVKEADYASEVGSWQEIRKHMLGDRR